MKIGRRENGRRSNDFSPDRLLTAFPWLGVNFVRIEGWEDLAGKISLLLEDEFFICR